MTYDPKVGWVIENLDPKSRHWKRLAWEINSKTAQNEVSPMALKWDGLTPLDELDSNLPN